MFWAACLWPIQLQPAIHQVYKLFADDRAKAGSKQSITAFFKPAAAK